MSIKAALSKTIYDALKGSVTNAGNSVYYLAAPDKEPLPYIIFDYVNEGDDNETPHRSKNCAVSIKVYAAKSEDADTIDGQVDTALHNKTLSITGWTNFWSMRENGYSFVETDASGRKTYMSGADYRIRATT